MCYYLLQWKGINHKQSTRWQHLSRLKASVFFSLQKFFTCYETQQLILGTGAAICGLYYKQVTIIIYDRNDIGLYYKTRDDRN